MTKEIGVASKYAEIFLDVSDVTEYPSFFIPRSSLAFYSVTNVWMKFEAGRMRRYIVKSSE